MNHLSEEQLTLACYDDIGPKERRHLEACAECRRSFEQIRADLNNLPDCPAPERPRDWEADVWNRLALHLPPPKIARTWVGWTLAPVVTMLLVVAFVAGILTERSAQHGLSQTARDRILLMMTGDHLEQSERVLAELSNAAPGVMDFAEERTRARRLVVENRLLRQTAAHDGNAYAAALLDELERTLLDIAHLPPQPSQLDLETLQQRIEREGLLFRIRIADANLHRKEQKL